MRSPMKEFPADPHLAEPNAPLGNTELAPGVFVRPAGIRLQFSRSGGPGGQNVNKINSKAELWVRLSDIVGLSHGAINRLRALAGNRITQQDEIHLRSETQRSQEANRQEVFDRLRQMIVEARIEPKVRKRTKPSKAARRRRVESKRKRGEIKSNRRGKIDEW